MSVLIIFLCLFLCGLTKSIEDNIIISGPGLKPEEIVMPARYFFINLTFINSESYNSEINKNIAVEIDGKSLKNKHCRVWINKLDRRDGTFIVRYKLYETCFDLSIHIYYKSKKVANSPFKYKGPIYPDQCVCPKKNLEDWMKMYGCLDMPYLKKQIEADLKPFESSFGENQVLKIIEKYHQPESTSFCHYAIKNNKIYRNCYGKHVGFNMFSDNILLSLARKVELPDMQLIMNLGDWPLVHRNDEVLPVFSWCGSDESYDIVLPTYDLTEATLENMGRVTLDTLSVQGGAERPWSNREPRAIWRGRDSRVERLHLIDIARANPDLFNASLTNFFFFRDKESQYGPKQPHISFFDFFNYKYQINIDGTVAAYRLPYLLAGGGMVLKQDSPYYEHFYKQLQEWEHYVPVKRDLSNLVERVKWAQDNDEKAKQISINARNFANDHLLPQNKWSKRMSSEVIIEEGMTHVPQPAFDCQCESQKTSIHEDL